MAIFKIYLFGKILVMEFLSSAQGTNKTLQSVRWPSESIILPFGHFESPPEVNWTVCGGLLVSNQQTVRECRLILLEREWTVF